MSRLDFADDIDEEPTAPGRGVIVTVAALVRAIDGLTADGQATRTTIEVGFHRLGKRIDRVVIALCLLSAALALTGVLWTAVQR